MSLKDNATSPFAYALWAIVMAVVILVLGIHYHPAFMTYVVGGGIWATGIIIMIVQIIKSGDTTLIPYIVQTIGAFVFGIMATS